MSIGGTTVVSGGGPTLDGQSLWGTCVKTQGPARTSRAMRQTIPGLSGYRLYRLAAAEKVVWTMTGRLLAPSKKALEGMILSGQRLMNGQLYTFRSSAGQTYRNCELTDYRSIDPQYTRLGFSGLYTVRVIGVVTWATPDA